MIMMISELVDVIELGKLYMSKKKLKHDWVIFEKPGKLNIKYFSLLLICIVLLIYVQIKIGQSVHQDAID